MVKKYSFLFIILAAILWSADGLLRRSLYSLPPTVVVLFEHILGLLLLLPFLLPKLKEIKTLTKKEWGAFLWVALLSGVLGTVLYTAALGKVQYISYSVVVLLQQLQPLIVVFFASRVLKETITKKYIVWAPCSHTNHQSHIPSCLYTVVAHHKIQMDILPPKLILMNH